MRAAVCAPFSTYVRAQRSATVGTAADADADAADAADAVAAAAAADGGGDGGGGGGTTADRHSTAQPANTARALGFTSL